MEQSPELAVRRAVVWYATRHGVRPGRDFGVCVQVWNASRYLLGGMHPASRTSSHLCHTERRASTSPLRGSHTAPTVRRPHTCVVHEVLTDVHCLSPHCCVARARARCALSASPSSASWHDRCRWAARQMLMRTASCGRCALHGTCYAARRVQLARPAYAAFSAVSSAICARSSAMPAGALSNVLGDLTAAPKGEIVPV